MSQKIARYSPYKHDDWLLDLGERIGEFLDTLAVPGVPGSYRPCHQGVTPTGEAAGLGFGCFALKTRYMLGQWQELPESQQQQWCDWIRHYEVANLSSRYRPLEYPFVDLAIYSAVAAKAPWWMRTLDRWMGQPPTASTYQLLIAETKQALATLAQVDEHKSARFWGFPYTPSAVTRSMQGHDWSRPWAAGGQTAALPVFLQLCWPAEQGPGAQAAALDACRSFYTQLAQRETGAYYTAMPSSHGELINGAMKVLTALDWLDQPIHYPERLIDTCLRELPAAEGCHVVDAVYVLYRCQRQTDHRCREIEQYLKSVLELIRLHHNPDGGFSYYIGRAQTSYYGAVISKGLKESDLHGTTLLVWALSMIDKILPELRLQWRAIKP